MIFVEITHVRGSLSHGENDVDICVFINTPLLETDNVTGCYFKDAPKVLISRKVLPFKEVGFLLRRHNCQNWGELALYIEKEYASYYEHFSK